MAKRTECLVCYENKFMTPCGALNSCKVYVCKDCKCKYEEEKNLYWLETQCMICKKQEPKRALIFNYYDFVEDGCNVYNRRTKDYSQAYRDDDCPLFDYIIKIRTR